MLDGGGASGNTNFGLVGSFCVVGEGNTFFDSVRNNCILSRGRFFIVSWIFWAYTAVRNMVEATINTFNFFPFVSLNGALGIMVVLCAFIEAGEKITVI